MKFFNFLFGFCGALLLSSCIYGRSDDDLAPVTENYRPVIMEREAFENAIQLQPAQAVTRPGKIYLKDGLLFIAEVNKGFHVYNYTDAQHPVPLAFIHVPGATDVAVRGTNLYINQATDLVTLTYSTTALSVTNRNRNVFPQKTPPDNSYTAIADNQIITDWIPR